jgi:5-(carboxyamino)imidazole ribonucleotide mutase
MATRSTSKTKAARRAGGRPIVGIIMGSQSDWATMQAASQILDVLKVPHETGIVSAHRTPDRMAAYAKDAESRGIKVIIAGAGGAAHLPGMVASMTTLPVLGVPVQSRALKGLDSLLSIAQMPGGVPVATFAIGEAGAKNAALHAAAIIGLTDLGVKKRLDGWRDKQTKSVAKKPR